MTGIRVSLRREGIRSRCQSLNRYAYVLNNPTTLTDPLGLGQNGCGPTNICIVVPVLPNPPGLGGGIGECPFAGCVPNCSILTCGPAPWNNGGGGGGGGKALGIEAREYARVRSVNQEQNQVTIERASGERVSYDPRRLQGVALYRETERAFAEGDRVQFTAPYREQHIANRDLGTAEKIDASGEVKIRLDSGREVQLNLSEPQHLDYGYAVTSHSSQGQTADRVLIHVDTEQAHTRTSLTAAWRMCRSHAPATMRKSTPTTERISVRN